MNRPKDRTMYLELSRLKKVHEDRYTDRITSIWVKGAIHSLRYALGIKNKPSLMLLDEKINEIWRLNKTNKESYKVSRAMKRKWEDRNERTATKLDKLHD